MSALDILRVQVEIDLGSKCCLPVFRQNFLDQFKIQLWLRHHGLQIDSTLVLLLEDDVGWSLVHSDPEPFQLVLQDFLVAERLQHVQHNKDDVGGSCHRNNLSKEKDVDLQTNFITPVCHGLCRPWLPLWFQADQEAGSWLPVFFIDFQWEEHYFEFKKAFAWRMREWVASLKSVLNAMIFYFLI